MAPIEEWPVQFEIGGGDTTVINEIPEAILTGQELTADLIAAEEVD